MSSRELIPDVFASLYKKARRSWSQHRTVPKNVAQGEEQQPRHDSAVSFDTTVVCKDSTMTAISTQGASSHTKEHKAVALMVADPGSPRQDNSQVLVAATSGTDRQDQQPSEPAAATSTLNYIHRIFPPLPSPAPVLPRDANTSQPDQQPAFSSPRLARPVLIPRVNPGPHMPFARAYAPPLAAHNVSKPDFLAFVDALNLVVRPHPAVTIAEFAAMVVGVVPHDAAEAAGSAVEALALATHAALVHRDKRRFLAVLNKEYFHPRALHVKVIGNKRLRAEHGLGRKDAMVLPLTEDTLDQSPQDRCLRFMEVKGFSGALEFEGIPQVATFVLPRRTQASRSQEEAAGIAVEEGSHGPGPTQQGKVSDLPAPNKPPLAQRLATWRIKHLIARAEREAKVQRRRAWKRHREKGKPLKEPSWGERSRVNQLDWLFVQNLDDWEAQRRAKEDKLREVQAVRRRRRAERTAGLGGVLTWKKTVR